MDVFLDIETIPTQRSDLRDRLAARIAPPTITKTGKYKSDEDLLAWMTDERPALIDEAVAKCGLNGAMGQVVCIGFAIDDGDVDCVMTGSEGAVEHTTLCLFHDAIVAALDTPRYKSRRPKWIGHNIINFDLRFLAQRAMACGVHELLDLLPLDAKPWSDNVYDTMTRWAGHGNRISLDDLCWALGLDGKSGMTGADVWPMYQRGEYERIRQYCAEDVERVRRVYYRMTGER